MLMCFCTGLFATLSPVYAASATAVQKTRKISSKSATGPDWGFQIPDRSAQNVRWRESINTTLQQTTFAPSAPSGRYLQNNATLSGKRLPPPQMEDLDKMRPPENKQRMLGGKIPVHGEFTRERISWRPNDNLTDGATSSLKEERRAGAYADFHPGEDVALKLGPEYRLGTLVARPEQTGYTKDNSGTLGMGMRLKIDF